MKALFKKPDQRLIILLFTIILFYLASGFFLKNDFWQDEIYTIEHFIFVPFKAVLFDYHSTNNHIAFSIIVQWFVSIFNLDSTLGVLEHPYLLRSVPFLFSILGLVFFYTGAKRHYGKLFAELGVSIWCTSIVFIDFSVQLRGYSLSILLSVLQYFVFLDLLKIKMSVGSLLKLAVLTLLSLLCLPTNIYLALSYLLFCFTTFFVPFVSTLVLNRKVVRKQIILIGSVIAITSVAVLMYYRWLLQMQPENPLITSLNYFNFKNIIQVFAVFYHFTDFRYHIYILLFVWAFTFYKGIRMNFYSKVFFPSFFFLVPFILFFIHGAIIIQRVFLSLFPFYVLIVVAAIEEIYLVYFKNRRFIQCIYGVNFFCLIISFCYLLSSSKRNNELSLHLHDLRNHYYLVNFNAREATLLAKEISIKENKKVYVWDDFGKTGVNYYLKHYQVPFEDFNKQFNVRQSFCVLTNNKTVLENNLNNKGIPFKRRLNKDAQYNLYFFEIR